MTSFEKVFLVPAHLIGRVKKCLSSSPDIPAAATTPPSVAASPLKTSASGSCACESRLVRLETLYGTAAAAASGPTEKRRLRRRGRTLQPVSSAKASVPPSGSDKVKGSGQKEARKKSKGNPTKQTLKSQRRQGNKRKDGPAKSRLVPFGNPSVSSMAMVSPAKHRMGSSAETALARKRRRLDTVPERTRKRKCEPGDAMKENLFKKFRPQAKMSKAMTLYWQRWRRDKQKKSGLMTAVKATAPAAAAGRKRKRSSSDSEALPWPQQRKMDMTLSQQKKNKMYLQSKRLKPSKTSSVFRRVIPPKMFPPAIAAPAPGADFLSLVKGIMQRAALKTVNVAPGVKRKPEEEQAHETKRFKMGEANKLKRKAAEWEELLSPLVKRKAKKRYLAENEL